MKIRLIPAIAGAVLLSGLASAAHAEARLSETKGQVLVNAGTGFVVHSGQTLKPGHRVMIGPQASARITFKDGCSLTMKPGLVTIPSASPCTSQAQSGGGFRAFITNPLVIAGVVATAIAVPVAIHNSRHNSRSFASP